MPCSCSKNAIYAACVQDFNSAKLRSKQHWNSFTTAFFVGIDKVLQDLEADKAVVMEPAHAEALLRQPLRCHLCQRDQNTMPALKVHINQCRG